MSTIRWGASTASSIGKVTRRAETGANLSMRAQSIMVPRGTTRDSAPFMALRDQRELAPPDLFGQRASDRMAVLVISSKLPELINVSSSVILLRDGRITGETSRSDATLERLLRMMAGL